MARVRVNAGLGAGADGVEHDLDITDGELFVLTGSVGPWSRTLLRRIAGLESAPKDVFFDHTYVNEVAAEARNVSMVFASGALYAHMGVRDNIAFGLLARGVSRAETKERVAEAAQAMGIEKLLTKSLTRLTAAERLRVSLARAIVRRPTVMLLDDALSGLPDAPRHELRTDLLRIQRRLKITTLMATSNVSDAMAIGHRVAFFDGTLRQLGTPLELYDRPADRSVAARVGAPAMTLLPLPIDGGHVTLGETKLPVPPAESIVLGLRPEALSIDRIATHSAPLHVTASLTELEGSRARVELSLGGTRLTMVCDPHRAPKEGAELEVFVDLQQLRLFTADTNGFSIPWDFVAARKPPEAQLSLRMPDAPAAAPEPPPPPEPIAPPVEAKSAEPEPPPAAGEPVAPPADATAPEPEPPPAAKEPVAPTPEPSVTPVVESAPVAPNAETSAPSDSAEPTRSEPAAEPLKPEPTLIEAVAPSAAA